MSVSYAAQSLLDVTALGGIGDPKVLEDAFHERMDQHQTPTTDRANDPEAMPKTLQSLAPAGYAPTMNVEAALQAVWSKSDEADLPDWRRTESMKLQSGHGTSSGT